MERGQLSKKNHWLILNLVMNKPESVKKMVGQMLM